MALQEPQLAVSAAIGQLKHHAMSSDEDYILGLKKHSYECSQFLAQSIDKHLLSIAPTRTGKGRGLVITNLLSLPNHSVFVIDPKGENALVSACYRRDQGHEVVIFNPYRIYAEEFAELGFPEFQSFNPLDNLDTSTQLSKYI